jgi:hypothetical protein
MLKNKAFLFIIGLLTSALLLEGGVRVASSLLGPPLVTWNTMEDAKRLKLDEFREKYQSPEYVFMGNSTTLIGLNPTVFDSKVGLAPGSSFNAAMNGSDIKTIRDFAQSYIIKKVKPKNLVLLFSNTAMIYGPKYEQIKSEKTDLLSNSYLYRYRNTFRDPMTINTILRVLKNRDTRHGLVYRWADNIDDFGYTKYETTDATYPEEGWVPSRASTADQQSYSVDLSNLKYLIEIRDFAIKNGVNLIIGTVPLLSQDLKYRGTVREIADKLGIGFIQGNNAVGQGRYFQDGIHLNKAGSRVFSEYLAETLSK